MPKLAALTLLLLATALHAAADRRQILIAGGPLAEVLLSVGREFEVSLVFAEEHLEDIEAPAFEGAFTITETLDRLLAGACLRYAFVRERLIALAQGCDRPASEDKPPVAPPPEPLPDTPIVEEILVQEPYVTGSRIRNPAFSQSMPIEVIDQTEIILSGYQAVSELLRYVPAVSGNSTSTLISNGGDGTATVTLRGLPASNTLVLLNGQRLNPDALGGKAVDLNTLPLAMVEQIEILKDGVSAIYGSDAIAGVVNVITKRDFTGLKLEAYRGGATQGDLGTENLTLLAGAYLTDGWSTQLGVNYYNQDGILSRDRGLSRSSDDRDRGGIDKRSSATTPGRIELDEGAIILMEGLAGTQAGDFRAATAEDRFEYRNFTSSIVPSRRLSYFFTSDYAITDRWRTYIEALYSTTKAKSQLAPVPIFTGFESTDLTVSAANIYNPFGVDLPDVRRRVAELPPRVQENRSSTERFILGFAYEGARVNFDLSMQSNLTRATERFLNALHAGNVQRALGQDCDAPCVPLNVFGPLGSITESMLAYIGTSAHLRGTSRMSGATVDFDFRLFELPAGSAELSAGIEYRLEKLNTRPDEVLLQRMLLGGGNRGAISGDRDVFETFAEAYVPLVRGLPGIHRLDLQIAGRWSNYSDFGQTTNPRVLINYEPTAGLILRGSLARGFRAPTLLQLHGSRFESFEQLNDPCSLPANVAVKPGCEQQSDPTLTQFLTIKGGDSNLDPERSTTASVGLFWAHKLGRHHFSTSADWFRIDQEDVVESSAQFIVNQNADTEQFPGRIERDANGNITRVNASLQNIGKRDVTGFDITTNWSIEANEHGRFSVVLNATHIIKFEDEFDPTAPTLDKSGTFSDEASGGLGALPDWKVNVGVSWQAEFWQGHYNVYHVSRLRETVPIVETSRTISSWTTQNVNFSYMGPFTNWIRLTIGGNNLFDKAPPFAAAAFNDSYDGRTYDITGRYLYLKLDRSF